MSPSLRSSFPFNQDWFQEEDKYKPLCFCLNVTLGTGSFCLFGLFFFFPFHGWFSPSPPTPRQKIKNGIKKNVVEALLLEMEGCCGNHCKSLVSPCLPSILLFWVIMQAVILENIAAFTWRHPFQRPCARSNRGTQPSSSQQPRLGLSSSATWNLHKRWREKKRSALCHCASHILGSAAIQGVRMLSEGAVGVHAAGEGSGRAVRRIMWGRQQTEAYLKRLQSNK